MYLLNLGEILANEALDVNIRVVAGLAAKNCLVARDSFRRMNLINTFRNIENSIKNQIKSLVIIFF